MEFNEHIYVQIKSLEKVRKMKALLFKLRILIYSIWVGYNLSFRFSFLSCNLLRKTKYFKSIQYYHMHVYILICHMNDHKLRINLNRLMNLTHN